MNPRPMHPDGGSAVPVVRVATPEREQDPEQRDDDAANHVGEADRTVADTPVRHEQQAEGRGEGCQEADDVEDVADDEADGVLRRFVEDDRADDQRGDSHDDRDREGVGRETEDDHWCIQSEVRLPHLNRRGLFLRGVKNSTIIALFVKKSTICTVMFGRGTGVLRGQAGIIGEYGRNLYQRRAAPCTTE